MTPAQKEPSAEIRRAIEEAVESMRPAIALCAARHPDHAVALISTRPEDAIEVAIVDRADPGLFDVGAAILHARSLDPAITGGHDVLLVLSMPDALVRSLMAALASNDVATAAFRSVPSARLVVFGWGCTSVCLIHGPVPPDQLN